MTRGMVAPLVGLPVTGARDRLLRSPILPVIVDDSGYVTIAPGTAPTYSSWTQMIASTTGEAQMLSFGFPSVSGAGVNSSCIWEIAFGGAGAEVAVLSGLLGYGSAAENGGVFKSIVVPIIVPIGTRISVRGTCATASRSGQGAVVRTLRWSRSRPLPGTPIALTTAPNGTTCVGSITNGTNTSYTEIVAASPQPLMGVVVTYGLNGSANISGVAGNHVIGVGPAGSEVALPVVPYFDSGVEVVFGPPTTFWGDIPTGARIAIRKTNASNTHDYHIYGIPRV